MLSVPAHFGLTLETIPAAPYLRAPDTGLGIPIHKPVGCLLTVGVVWAGSSGYIPDMRRSMPFHHMLRLVDLPQLAFVSLQKGERVGDIAAHGMRSLIGDLSGLLGDFADTAAALMQVDIVVSVDTSVLHLAGALGRPTIALLSNWRCWRWLTGRDDTPWYPSMRLVTQETPGDWPGVMDQVRQIICEAEIETQTTVTESVHCSRRNNTPPEFRKARPMYSIKRLIEELQSLGQGQMDAPVVVSLGRLGSVGIVDVVESNETALGIILLPELEHPVEYTKP
jgi:hypothetical protein